MPTSQATLPLLISALISGVLSGVIVALLNYWLTRRKLTAEISFIEVQTEKIRRELSDAVDYNVGSAEQIIYDSSKRGDIGFDFQGSKAKIWKRIDGVDKAISGDRLGQLTFENGVLNITRSNTEGRYEVWLRSYTFQW